MGTRKKTDNTMGTRKRTNNDLQNTTQKTKNWATRISLKSREELGWSGRVSSSCSTSDARRVTVTRHEHHLTRESCWTPVDKQVYDCSFKISITFTFFWGGGSHCIQQGLSPTTTVFKLLTSLLCILHMYTILAFKWILKFYPIHFNFNTSNFTILYCLHDTTIYVAIWSILQPKCTWIYCLLWINVLLYVDSGKYFNI